MYSGYFPRWCTTCHSFPDPLNFSRWRSSQISTLGIIVDVKTPTFVRFTKSNSRGLPNPPILGQTIDRCITHRCQSVKTIQVIVTYPENYFNQQNFIQYTCYWDFFLFVLHNTLQWGINPPFNFLAIDSHLLHCPSFCLQEILEIFLCIYLGTFQPVFGCVEYSKLHHLEYCVQFLN